MDGPQISTRPENMLCSRMLRPLALAAALSLCSAATALACSCVSFEGEQQLAELMDNVEVRITVPVRHSLQVNGDGERGDYTVITTHRVLDPLGRGKTGTLQTISSPQDGGSCGVTPAIGVVGVLNASRWKDDTLYTGSCGNVPGHMAALYQRDGLDRRIPSRLACTELSEVSKWQLRRLKEDGEDMSGIGSERDNPMCEFHVIDDDGPILRDFKDRLEDAKAAAADRGTMPVATAEPREPQGNAQGNTQGDSVLVFGLPVRSELTAQGRRLTRVMILEDFGTGLGGTVDVTTLPDPDEPWSEIEVGVRQIFAVDALGTLRRQSWEDDGDYTATLYAQLTGSTLPEACVENRWEDEALCDPLMDPFEARMMDMLYGPLSAEALAAALAAE